MKTNASAKNSKRNEEPLVADAGKRHIPPFKALLAFDAAARHANFTQAAAELVVTPSAVSHHIQSLEDFLGAKLFLRRAGHVLLTQTGRIYHKEVESALSALADATQRIAPQSQTDTLVVLSNPGIAAKWLQPRLPDFLADCGNTRIRLATLSDTESISSVRFDVAICYGTPPASDLNVVPFMSERVRPLCSPALAARLGLKSIADLSRATLIHSSNLIGWDVFFRSVGCPDVSAYNELWLDRSAMAIDAAINGLGVILESDILAETELREGRLVAPFTGEQAHMSVDAYHLAMPRGYRSRHHCVKFVDWLLRSVPYHCRPSGTPL